MTAAEEACPDSASGATGDAVGADEIPAEPAIGVALVFAVPSAEEALTVTAALDCNAAEETAVDS